eukprot:1534319-Lingulodinium_polyedra.AAC.1
MEVGARHKRKLEPNSTDALGVRGFMDWEAFSVDTFSGAAKRSSQIFLASEAACRKDWVLASLDIDKAFLK